MPSSDRSVHTTMKGTAMKKRSIREVLIAALEIAEASPDYIYEKPDGEFGSCVYVNRYTGEGSCLFGQALIRVYGKKAVTFIQKHTCEGQAITQVLVKFGVTGISEQETYNLMHGGLTPSEMSPAMHAAYAAQNKQDQGLPWSECALVLRNGLVAALGGAS